MSEPPRIIETMFDTPVPPLTADELREREVRLLDSLVISLVATRKGMAALHALEAQMLAAALALGLEQAEREGVDPGLPVRDISAEIGAALHVSDRTVQRQLDEAHTLSVGFPALHDALARGAISRTHVSGLIEVGAHLDEAARAAFEQEVLPIAERESPARAKAYARHVAERLTPRSLGERHSAAATRRHVRVCDLEDGMSELRALLPSTLAHGIHDRLTSMAKVVADAERTSDDAGGARTFDQLRADLLAELCLSGSASGGVGAALDHIRAEVCVTVPVMTLIDGTRFDADDGSLSPDEVREPALLAGAQPIDIDTATRLAGGAEGWVRILTHPITGTVLETDRYRPGRDLRRLLRAIDERCRFPGCRVVAHRCDVDHLHDAAHGGETARGNLAHECRRHHVLKHHSAWRVHRGADDAVNWTSPTGRVYSDLPRPRVRFSPPPDEPP